MTTANKKSCLLTFCEDDLKVNFLLARKLNKNETVVETVLAPIFGAPKEVRPNKIPKSIKVLAVPTAPKRSLVWCFCNFSFMVFVNQVERTLFCFGENSSNIFPDYP